MAFGGGAVIGALGGLIGLGGGELLFREPSHASSAHFILEIMRRITRRVSREKQRAGLEHLHLWAWRPNALPLN
jgi:hypothetical protein